ncbi:MAG: hypothetical protein GF335_00490 [Candidatus Moranbacteria bacterium]|nr:hypothetical protein [Candidatus Moranbacteria bacterium]
MLNFIEKAGYGFLIVVLFGGCVYLAFLLKFWSIPFFILYFFGLLIMISYQKDISIPFLGKSLRQAYFDTKYRIIDRSNSYENTFISKVKLGIYKTYLKFLRFLILLFKNSRESFETVREDSFLGYKLATQKVSIQDEIGKLEQIINKLKQGERVDLNSLEYLYHKMYALHKRKQKRVTVFSLAGLIVMISSTIISTMAVSFVFPTISRPNASSNSQFIQQDWSKGKTLDFAKRKNWQYYFSADSQILAGKDLSLDIEKEKGNLRDPLKEVFLLDGQHTSEDKEFINNAKKDDKIIIKGQVDKSSQAHQKIIGESSIYFDGQGAFMEIDGSDSWKLGNSNFDLSLWFNNQSAKPFDQYLLSKWETDAESFKDKQAWTSFDSAINDGYEGAVFDGRYVYFVPYRNDQDYHGEVLRYDTQQDFNQKQAWTSFDPGFNKGYKGAVFDGRYVYFAPYQNQKRHGDVLRYDTQKAFDQMEAWSHYDSQLGQGYVGAVFDGRFVYFVPYSNKKQKHGKVLRYDTQKDFKKGQAWEDFDSGLGKGFSSAVFDQKYIYFTPYHDGASYNGKVIRYDSVQNKASFKLLIDKDYNGKTGNLIFVLNTGQKHYILKSDTRIKNNKWYQVEIKKKARNLEMLLDKDQQDEIKLDRAVFFNDYNSDLIVGSYPYASSGFKGFMNQVSLARGLALENKNQEPALISSPFDTENDQNVINKISWFGEQPGDSLVKIQLRTAPDDDGKPGEWSKWMGPQGQDDYYYDMEGNHHINETHSDKKDDRWFQYKVILMADEDISPVLSMINIKYWQPDQDKEDKEDGKNQKPDKESRENILRESIKIDERRQGVRKNSAD